VAAIIAARSAHELGRFTRAEAFLEQARGKRARRSTRRASTRSRQTCCCPRPPRGGARGAQGPFDATRGTCACCACAHVAETQLRQWGRGAFNAAALAKLGGLSESEASVSRRAAHLGNLGRKAQDAGAPPRTGSTARELRVDSSIRGHRRSLPTSRALAARPRSSRSSNPRSRRRGDAASSRSTPMRRRPRAAPPSSSAAEKWLPRAAARDPALLLALRQAVHAQDPVGQGAKLHRGRASRSSPRTRAT